MFKEDRHNNILKLINQQGSVKTTELQKIFNTTRQTIHNDLDYLDQKGKLKKVYGGAILQTKSEEPSVDHRRVQNRIDKNVIGRVAASFVNEKDTVFLDVSTTVYAMFPYLLDFKDLTIITTSIEVAYTLGKQTSFEIHLVGGQVRNKDLGCVGSSTIQMLKDIYVDKSFFGTGGISLSAGLTDYHFSDSNVRKIMISNSTENFLLFDVSKIDVITISKFANLTDIDNFISYNLTDELFLNYFSEEGLNLIDAKPFVVKESTQN